MDLLYLSTDNALDFVNTTLGSEHIIFIPVSGSIIPEFRNNSETNNVDFPLPVLPCKKYILLCKPVLVSFSFNCFSIICMGVNVVICFSNSAFIFTVR